MENNYHIDRTVWTDDDFEQMSWHDSHIHAFSFNDNFELLMDIDYIFKWVKPKKGSRYYNFWIAPCTLIFENVYDIVFESDYKQPIIDYVERSNPTRPKNADYIGREAEFDWDIVMINAEMSFKSVGYKQYVRRQPVLIKEQFLEIEIRKGISFDKIYED